jgi:hypothetical protein
MPFCLTIVTLISLALLQPPAGSEGLWAYETLARGGGPTVPTAGLFVLHDGRFVQQSVNVGEPYERQLAQAHAGTYHLESGTLRLVAEVGVVIDPTSAIPIESRDGSVHQVTAAGAGDRLHLTFGTGTVQTFTRLGPGRGEQVQLDRGALALVDGHFVLVAEGPNRATSGSGSFERQGESLRLHAERWVSIRSGAPAYTRNRVIEARLTASTLTIDGEEWPVVASRR